MSAPLEKYFNNESYILSHPWLKEELDFLTHGTKEECKSLLVTKLQTLIKGTFLEPAKDLIAAHQSPGINFFLEVGPTFSIETGALHEIAHAIQLKKRSYKNLKNGLYYNRPKTSCNTVFGVTYYEPMTAEPTIMECETVAIQLHLLELLGYKIDHAEYFTRWSQVLTNGGLPDFVSGDSKQMVCHFLHAFYISWTKKEYVMTLRLNNFLKYVQKMCTT